MLPVGPVAGRVLMLNADTNGDQSSLHFARFLLFSCQQLSVHTWHKSADLPGCLCFAVPISLVEK